MHTLELLGGGKMGEALLGGLLAASAVDPADVLVVERVAERRAELAERYGVAVADRPVGAPSVIVATKPDDVPDALGSLAGNGVERVLSIAAGVSVSTMEQLLGPGVAVVRAMPNTPSLVGLGAAAICGGSATDETDLAWAESVLGAVGSVVRVDEPDMDAVTGLSGSGPAYVFLVAEALIDAGVAAGLAPEVADALVRRTLLGAATLLDTTGEDPAVLRAAVTSPGGTTQAGLQVLGERGVADALGAAVDAAARRSRELGT